MLLMLNASRVQIIHNIRISGIRHQAICECFAFINKNFLLKIKYFQQKISCIWTSTEKDKTGHNSDF